MVNAGPTSSRISASETEGNERPRQTSARISPNRDADRLHRQRAAAATADRASDQRDERRRAPGG